MKITLQCCLHLITETLNANIQALPRNYVFHNAVRSKRLTFNGVKFTAFIGLQPYTYRIRRSMVGKKADKIFRQIFFSVNNEILNSLPNVFHFLQLRYHINETDECSPLQLNLLANSIYAFAHLLQA